MNAIKSFFSKKVIIFSLCLLLSLSFMISISVTQLALVFLLLFFIYDIFKRNVAYRKIPFYKYFTVLFLLMSMTIMLNNYNSEATGSPFQWWMFMLFFIGVTYVNSEAKALSSLTIILIGGTISSLLGIYQFLMLNQRAQGFDSMALTAGNNWAIMLIVTFGLFICGKFRDKKHINFLLFVSFIIFLFAIIASQSRGPLLSSLITIVVLSIIYLNKKAKISVLLLIFAFAVILPIVSNTWQNRISDFYNKSWENSETSFGTRLVLWKTSLHIIKDNFLIGIGSADDSFRKIAKQKIRKPVSSLAHAHNSFLMFTVQYGIIVSTVLIFIFISIFFFYLKHIKASPYAVIGLGVLLVFLFEGMTENNIGDSEVLMLFWFLTGVLLNQTQIQSKSNE